MDERIVGYMKGANLRGQSRQDTFDKLTGIGVSYKEIMEDFTESAGEHKPNAKLVEPETAPKKTKKQNHIWRLAAAIAGLAILAALIRFYITS